MSQLFVDNIKNRTGGAINAPSGIVVSGVGTFTGIVVSGVGTFTGDVSIGGTLTYEDVTNVDSVGVITARSGVNVSGGSVLVGSAVTINATGVNVVGVVTARSGLHLTGVYKENITAVPALEIDCSSGNYFTKTISGISTFTFANVPSSGAYSFTLELTHTSGTVSWPTSVKWPSDTAPTLSTGKTHLFMFLTDDGGTRFRGSSLVDYVN